jgi:tripartite-type tricarboxylate transporter receptor subunit TctC
MAPGGSNDILARPVSEKLALAWRNPVIVDNRPGAGSIIGADVVARAPPDGYTSSSCRARSPYSPRFSATSRMLDQSALTCVL